MAQFSSRALMYTAIAAGVAFGCGSDDDTTPGNGAGAHGGRGGGDGHAGTAAGGRAGPAAGGGWGY